MGKYTVNISIRNAGACLAAALVLFMLWNSYRTSTAEIVTILRVSKDEITVRNMSDRERTIHISLDLSGLLAVDKEYFVQYDKRLLDKYRLRKIE